MSLPRHIWSAAAIAAAMLSTACSKQESEPEAAAGDAARTVASTATELPAALPRTASPDDARLFFVSLTDGAAVANPILVEFGLEGMTVTPAGVAEAQSGHHHLLIDTELPDFGLPIPADSNRIHFGDGSTSTELTLAQGGHTLQLLLGDHLHIPHDPPVLSKTITISVE